jgi:hypothetical protein
MFSTAPANSNDEFAMKSLYDFAAKYAMQQPVALNIRLSKELPRDLKEFGDLCVRHSILDLYMWLSVRHPKYFIERDICLQQKLFAVKQIEQTLHSIQLQKDQSHSSSYASMREKMGGRLPSSEFPQVVASYKENIAKIPKELHYVVNNSSNPKKYNRSFQQINHSDSSNRSVTNNLGNDKSNSNIKASNDNQKVSKNFTANKMDNEEDASAAVLRFNMEKMQAQV